MSEHQVTRLNWRGGRSVDEALAVMKNHGRVELELPPDLHHTLFVHLNPDARPARVEQLDVDGGADLLHKLAQIRHLEAFAEIAGQLPEGARVNVSSPAPTVVIHAEAAG